MTSDTTVEQVFHVETGVARVRILGRDASPLAGVLVTASAVDPRWSNRAQATEADGWITLDPVPAGRIDLTVRPKHLADPEAWQAFWKASVANPAAVEAQTKIAIGHLGARPRDDGGRDHAAGRGRLLGRSVASEGGFRHRRSGGENVAFVHSGTPRRGDVNH